MYYEVYDFLSNWFFGGGALTGYVDMCCSLLSTAVTVFVSAIPFIIVYFGLRWLCSLIFDR